jgi:hypothetical protein
MIGKWFHDYVCRSDVVVDGETPGILDAHFSVRRFARWRHIAHPEVETYWRAPGRAIGKAKILLESRRYLGLEDVFAFCRNFIHRLD